MGLIVAANFLGFHTIQHRLGPWLDIAAGPIRLAAGYTFAVYLFHYPMLMCFGAIFGERPLVLFPLTCISILICGEFSERKKQRYREIVQGAVERLKRRMTPPDPQSG